MTDTEERPTIGESFGIACESSNLKLSERRGDVDLIIAAGLIPDGLASSMFRLHVEYDRVRNQHAVAEKRMRELEKMAPNEVGEDDETGETAAERAAKILKEAEREALTAHLLILSHLTSLREAKARFADFAVIEATRRRFMKNDRAVIAIAGRVLDVFLAPNCRHCEGRGYNGGAYLNDPKVYCRPCAGSGHRRDSIGQDDAERGFASHLLMQVNALLFQAQRDILTGLNMVKRAKERIAEAGHGAFVNR